MYQPIRHRQSFVEIPFVDQVGTGTIPPVFVVPDAVIAIEVLFLIHPVNHGFILFTYKLSFDFQGRCELPGLLRKFLCEEGDLFDPFDLPQGLCSFSDPFFIELNDAQVRRQIFP